MPDRTGEDGASLAFQLRDPAGCPPDFDVTMIWVLRQKVPGFRLRLHVTVAVEVVCLHNVVLSIQDIATITDHALHSPLWP